MRGKAWTSAAAIFVILGAPTLHAQSMTLTSGEVGNGATIKNEQAYNAFGCRGGNISPGLAWTATPSAAKSIAVTMFDPDAPTGHGWWHWIVYDIPPSVASLPKNAGDPAAKLLPAGAAEARNDFGTAGYGGPCPPPGKPHRYVFTVYALDAAKLPGGSETAAGVNAAIEAHALGKASLTTSYGR